MFLTLLLQAAPAGENYTSLLFPVVIGLIVYFFMIRPQQRRASDAKKFRESIAKGTNVVTIGGLHGKVIDVTPETVVLEVERGIRLRFDRSAVARQAGTPAAPAAAATTEPAA
ncbi:preprotein translocase subunit YajC [Hymenobacter sp. J193]|uniref:preprotein translocase subunit YajC n=1 Tax=Hymenobacter sp. J193 TaxID=2898429 RepID=UPI002151BEA1|nr:preprotein translocase subunit YajC [Hymenobacter sp. J193]MCR5888025.1 preprotein translocase subunit YajC [Hymenobacter sp. J193]